MKIFLILILVLFFIVFGFSATFAQKEGYFQIKPGESLSEIAKNLKTEGFFINEFPFYFLILTWGKEKDLKPGFYQISKYENLIEIAKKIINGRSYKIKITFPEGLNLKEIEQKLIEKGILTEKKLQELETWQFKEKFPFLEDAPPRASLEGFLFPDTYFFDPKTKAPKIAEIFLKNFDKKLAPHLKQKIKQDQKTIFEVIILASLIEKEVRGFEDKKLISGILWKRLENRIPLQVDATITYITGKKTIKITKQETEIDHPYNTYKYLGLPPGPICNPGLESILASIYPQDSEYWYYLSTLEGKTIFSKTLKDHNLAKAKYLK